jgi:hypothetical protein
MIKMPALAASIALLLGTYSIALCQEAKHDTADKSMASISNATVPITDEGLQRLGCPASALMGPKRLNARRTLR